MHEFDLKLRTQVREFIEGINTLLEQGDHTTIATRLTEIPADATIPVKLGALRVTRLEREQFQEPWTALRDQVLEDIERLDLRVDTEQMLSGLLDD